MIELDGSHGEGGGQVLRTALSLSVLTGRGFRITNIRAGRDDPGLRPQHLAGIRLISEISSAEVAGDQVGSDSLEFHPGQMRGGRYRFDVGTAGSLTLLMQTVLPALVVSPIETELELIGGTDVRWSPPIDHYAQVLFPILRLMGARLEMNVERRGFYPQGGGAVHLKVSGGKMGRFGPQQRGELRRVLGTAFVQNLPAKVGERLIQGARTGLPGVDLDITLKVSSGASTGAGVALAAEYENTVLGWNSLGERGVAAERVGRVAAAGLLEEMEGGGILDVHTADQLLPFMANEGSYFTVREISGHLRTQIWLIPQFVPIDFRIGEGSPHLIEVINRT